MAPLAPNPSLGLFSPVPLVSCPTIFRKRATQVAPRRDSYSWSQVATCLTGPQQSGTAFVSGTNPIGAGETILVVDDEAAIRSLMVEVLEEVGYRVLQAGGRSKRVGHISSRRISRPADHRCRPARGAERQAGRRSRAGVAPQPEDPGGDRLRRASRCRTWTTFRRDAGADEAVRPGHVLRAGTGADTFGARLRAPWPWAPLRLRLLRRSGFNRLL